MESLKISQKYSLEYIRPIEWAEIFGKWKEYEAGQVFWKKHWEKRGFDSWDEWREAYAAPITSEKLEWSLYKINNPLEDFPDFYGVPSRGWIKLAYKDKTTKKLKEIVGLPMVAEHPKVQDMRKNFPKVTMLTGLIYNDDVVLIEGMHRACTLASWDKSVPFDSEITFALAEWNQKEIPVIGGNYKK